MCYRSSYAKIELLINCTATSRPLIVLSNMCYVLPYCRAKILVFTLTTPRIQGLYPPPTAKPAQIFTACTVSQVTPSHIPDESDLCWPPLPARQFLMQVAQWSPLKRKHREDSVGVYRQKKATLPAALKSGPRGRRAVPLKPGRNGRSFSVHPPFKVTRLDSSVIARSPKPDQTLIITKDGGPSGHQVIPLKRKRSEEILESRPLNKSRILCCPTNKLSGSEWGIDLPPSCPRSNEVGSENLQGCTSYISDFEDNMGNCCGSSTSKNAGTGLEECMSRLLYTALVVNIQLTR
ncbi:hypothetical protein BKA83DRAFT_4133992 [Pisolithus microcarpus]|nr:hypothetical protein BKA83DRAFT_4133992 [Pisolithus microcarpus]